MTQRTRQQVFLEIANQLAVLDAPTLTRLLHAVPDPEKAIQYLLEKRLIDGDKAGELKSAYRVATSEIQPADARPASTRGLPSPPPPPGQSPPATNSDHARKKALRSTESQPRPDITEVDAFDALIDEILND